MSILSDRTDKASFAKASILFLVSVAVVAAVDILLFSVASISLLGESKETLTLFRNHNSHLEDKVVGALVSHMDSDASQVPVQTQSPSASNADNISSSTPVRPSSGMLAEQTLAAPALKPTTNREASTPTVETSNGSARAPSTDEMPRPEPSPSQEVSIAAGTPTVETSNGSARAPSTDEMPSPEPSPSQEVRPSPASIADAGNAAQDASGATMPPLAISHEQRNQRFQNFEKQRHHANLDEGSVAFASEIDFPKKTQIKESKGLYGSSAGPESKSPVRHAAPHGRGAKAGNIADKLNHAELSRLVQRNRVLR